MILSHLEGMSIDVTTMNVLRPVWEKSKKYGIVLILSGIRSRPLFSLERSGLFYLIGEENIVSNIDVALNLAKEMQAAGTICAKVREKR